VQTARYNGTADERIAELQRELTEAWTATIERHGGKLSVLRYYRKSLSQPELTVSELCEYHQQEYEAEGGFCPREGDGEVFVPCQKTGCGKWAECPADGEVCECTNGDTVPAEDFATSRSCEQRFASTSQQRVFWTLSCVIHAAGFALSLRALWEFIFNKRLRAPYVLMQSFLAILVPDFAYSCIYFFFHFSNLLRGSQVESGPCDAIAFLTYGIVIATFCGPVIVSAVTYLKLKKLSQGDIVWTITGPTLSLLLLMPWIVGIAFAIIVQQDGYLGSYRGLYCYATDWSQFTTGGLTMITFLCSTTMTICFYLLSIVGVRKTMVKAKQQEAARRASRTIAVRGAILVAAYFLTWILWTGVGFSSWLGSVPSIPLETVAALITSLQPIIDGFILLHTPVVRAHMLQRLMQQVGESELNPSLVTSTTNPAKTAKAATPHHVHVSVTSEFSEKANSKDDLQHTMVVPGWRTKASRNSRGTGIVAVPETKILARPPKPLVRSYTFANHQEGLSNALLYTPESSPVNQRTSKKRLSSSKSTSGGKSPYTEANSSLSTPRGREEKPLMCCYSES